ncbi:MAG: hypothetical protein A2341_18200 [Deltaproteobacteria bacterium RIFOXYB12_FULL_58_9]|nr:MAG: hypothetical protein A2341_18200 [Deltaproteobacteria bacterium RIFOXYB12_FULL_58_9]
MGPLVFIVATCVLTNSCGTDVAEPRRKVSGDSYAYADGNIVDDGSGDLHQNSDGDEGDGGPGDLFRSADGDTGDDSGDLCANADGDSDGDADTTDGAGSGDPYQNDDGGGSGDPYQNGDGDGSGDSNQNGDGDGSGDPYQNGDGDGSGDSNQNGDGDTGLATDTDVGPVACDETNAADLCGGLALCVDGFCCDTTCDGECDSCNVADFEGQCMLLESDVICRNSNGPCDVEEACTGVSPACPGDLFLDDIKCGVAQLDDPCDLDDYCDGLGAACQDDFRGVNGERCSDAGECCEGTCDSAVNVCAVSCVDAEDWTPCAVVTTPDRSYDICMGGVCVSPGCGDESCNVPGPHFPLADNNLRQCYDAAATMICPAEGLAYFGQDAQYGWDTTHETTVRFTQDVTFLSNPIVIDNVTLLEWQGCAAGREREGCLLGGSVPNDWHIALAYCDSLDWGGHSDWRLPDEYELLSIVHGGRTNPAIDESFFPSTPWGGFWASSTYADDLTSAWRVSFAHGNMYFNDKIAQGYTRCVRGGPFLTRQFEVDIVNGDRVVTDTLTGLQWQGCINGKSGDNCTAGLVVESDWVSALAVCENANWAGFTDWRLPNIQELTSIADHRRYGPAIDVTTFPSTPLDWFWSSSAYPGGSPNSRLIGFGHGFMGDLARTSNVFVRCVRLGL